MIRVCDQCGQPVNTPLAGVILIDEVNTIRGPSGTVRLTRMEFLLVEAFLRVRPRIATRNFLHDALYADRSGWSEPDPKIIDVKLVHIRKKLLGIGLVIKTVWGIGWTLELRDGAS